MGLWNRPRGFGLPARERMRRMRARRRKAAAAATAAEVAAVKVERRRLRNRLWMRYWRARGRLESAGQLLLW